MRIQLVPPGVCALYRVCGLVALCLSILAPLSAQTVNGTSVAAFPAGSQPVSSMLQASDGNFYGVTNAGGANGAGSVYLLTPAGVMSTVYSFTGLNDGGFPAAGLVEGVDGLLYGTTTLGGANGLGTIYRLQAGVVTTLHSFDPNADGNSAYSALIPASDGNLYGTLAQGGYDPMTEDYAGGTLFGVSTTGDFLDLYSFPEDGSLGSLPSARLVQASDGNLWGTTSNGGMYGYGTAFFWNPAGGLKVMHDFTEAEGESLYGLAEFGGSLYGTTFPALTGYGEVFAIDVATHAFGVVYTFSGENDGGSPASALLPYSDGRLYGTTQAGGAFGTGTLFLLGLNGVPQTLYSFPAGSLNTFADAAMIESMDGTIYLPILFDASTGLGSFGMDGAGNVMLLQPDISPTPPAPVSLTASPAAVAPGQSVTLRWSLPDSDSLTAQQCLASSIPTTMWTGKVAASGSMAVTLPSVERYQLALTCGGDVSTVLSVLTENQTAVALAVPSVVAAGQNATFTATVNPAGGGFATGTVTFLVNGNVTLATVTLVNSIASLTVPTSGVPAGTYPIAAVYSGDSFHAGSSSAPAQVRVTLPASTTTLALSASSINPGQAENLTATVTASGGVPTGQVSFLYVPSQQSFVLANVPLSNGKATLAVGTTGLPAGTYPIRVSYAGSGAFSASTSVTENVTVR